MPDNRIISHPILPVPPREEFTIFWQGKPIIAKEGETIASALFANGIRVFGYHPKDQSPQGIFCANGQCAQCLALVNGMAVKACMEIVQPGIRIEPLRGRPHLPKQTSVSFDQPIQEIEIPVLILGAGPAGMSAAIELGKLGISTILVDDKQQPGGKLVLQTHRFFGSSDAVFAGTRGIQIAARLKNELSRYPGVDMWLGSTALAVFSDRKVGILREGRKYVLVTPQVLLSATGAREKFLAFPGNTLPGVIGAGAFQTLVNRDLVRPAQRLFIIGGGNVGLIAGYHALQAGIQVVGLAEAMPECGGYKVHKDKLVRSGVPVYTAHTILSANGKDKVESVTIARVDDKFHPVPGSQQTFGCDCVLVAVGLDSVKEFHEKAIEFGMSAFVAGDAEEIAEASAAMFSGKIRGLEIARFLGCPVDDIPKDWYRSGEILKSRPGAIVEPHDLHKLKGIYPVFHCTQEIPCDPCASICPKGLIFIDPKDIRAVPSFTGSEYSCVGCEKCVAVCPGLAITLVDYRFEPTEAIVSIPFEFDDHLTQVHESATVLDTEGNILGKFEVVKVEKVANRDRTLVIKVRTPRQIASRIAGIRVQEIHTEAPMSQYVPAIADEALICRCERVSAGEIRRLIKAGYRDLNEIKAITRAAMGACAAKTCDALILRLFRDEGILVSQLTDVTRRPLYMETTLGAFAGTSSQQSTEKD